MFHWGLWTFKAEELVTEPCIRHLLANIQADLPHIHVYPGKSEVENWFSVCFSAGFMLIYRSTHHVACFCLYGGCECPKGEVWETSRTDRPDPRSAVGESRRMRRIRRSIHHLMLYCCWITIGREKAFHSPPPSWYQPQPIITLAGGYGCYMSGMMLRSAFDDISVFGRFLQACCKVCWKIN